LSLSTLQGIDEKQLAGNLDLIKLVSEVDKVKSSKKLKLELRSKLGNILNPNVRSKTSKNDSIQPRKNNSLTDLKSIVPAYHGLKLGKVKFFDATKGFGYIHSIDDKKDCFIHVSQVVSGPISENRLVILQTRDNRRKPGELEAINVSNRLPVYCFTKETASRSMAIPLLQGHLDKEYVLSEKPDAGFYFLEATERSANWHCNATPSPHDQNGLPYYIGEILKTQLL